MAGLGLFGAGSPAHLGWDHIKKKKKGRGPPSDSEESVYPLSFAESARSKVSFARSLTHSLEEAAVVGGNSVSLKHPDPEEDVATGEAGSEA